jgi:very-short-patch-repair endonuclease
MSHFIICLFCKKPFESPRKDRKFCNQKCCKNHSKKGVDVECYQCGKKCYKPKNKNHCKKTFCSKKCSMDYQRGRRPVRICIFCGQTFHKKARADAKYCSWECRRKSPENIKHLAEIRKKQCGKKENKLEKKGYEILKELGYKIEKQYIYGDRLLADAYIPKLNLLIQFDGDYWHGNIRVFPNLSDQQKKQQKKDAKANAYALKCGYNLVRCWESELSKDNLKSSIQKAVQGEKNVPTPDRRRSSTVQRCCWRKNS